MPKTLDSFEQFLTPSVSLLEFPHMHLDVGDRERPLFEGPGRFYFDGNSRITFQFDAKPSANSAALGALRRSQEEPYTNDPAMRLRGIDSSGVEWSARWVRPASPEIWLLTGETLGE